MLGISEAIQAVAKVVDKIIPDPVAAANAKLELLKLEQNGTLAPMLAQLEINKVEAASSCWFVAGWRPAVGWICAFAMGYAAVLEPIMRFVASVIFGYAGGFPVLDHTLTMQVLFGILGLGAYRTYEKYQEVPDTKLTGKGK